MTNLERATRGTKPDQLATQRTLMFTALVAVMASAPTRIAIRALQERRADDFPLGGALVDGAIVIFALMLIGILTAFFWRPMSLAAWNTSTVDRLLGAGGAVLATIGASHLLASLVNNNSITESWWVVAFLALLIYGVAGVLALRLAQSFATTGGPGTRSSTARGPSVRSSSSHSSSSPQPRPMGAPSQSVRPPASHSTSGDPFASAGDGHSSRARVSDPFDDADPMDPGMDDDPWADELDDDDWDDPFA